MLTNELNDPSRTRLRRQKKFADSRDFSNSIFTNCENAGYFCGSELEAVLGHSDSRSRVVEW
jgi:hypothetical protein